MKKGKDFIGVGCWGIVTGSQNQILLIRKKGNDYWERPGGKVRVGETLEDSIVRKLKEETNISAKVNSFVFFDEIILTDNNEHWIAFCYHLVYEYGEIENMEPKKHEEVKWFSCDNLPKLSPYTKKAIEKILKKNNEEKIRKNKSY